MKRHDVRDTFAFFDEPPVLVALLDNKDDFNLIFDYRLVSNQNNEEVLFVGKEPKNIEVGS